ncbi:MAG: hypothetical protein GKS03_03975 [Alphaproteobacteria bacterium]|nr:hypothetical protein [Alphaproteobacteria bacterium]
MHGIKPFNPPLDNRLQVTTPNMVEAVMDLTLGDLRVVKQPAGGKAALWAGPICHFCGLAPMDTYFALADQLRDEMGLDHMDPAQFQAKVMTPNAHHEQAVTE